MATETCPRSVICGNRCPLINSKQQGETRAWAFSPPVPLNGDTDPRYPTLDINDKNWGSQCHFHYLAGICELPPPEPQPSIIQTEH
jgi:hypothetical protein